MKEKKNGLEIIVIFLSILLTALVGYIVIDKLFINNNIANSKLLELDKFSEYVNYDDTYASMKELKFENKNDGMIYSLNLSMDGKLYYVISGETFYIKNINNVVDIVSLRGGIDKFDDSKWYILTNNGEVFVYSVLDMINTKEEVVKVKNLKNVDRLIEFHHYASLNSNVVDGIVAILDNGKIVEVGRNSL